MSASISLADLTAPALADLVARHAAHCDATAPADSCHRLGIAALAAQDVTVWQADLDGTLVGMAALRALSPTDGEIKSMHTTAQARGQGVARALMVTLLTEARARGYTALWLETGVHPDFAAARRLYETLGFTITAPFGAYAPDPHSLFMTLDLTSAEAHP